MMSGMPALQACIEKQNCISNYHYRNVVVKIGKTSADMQLQHATITMRQRVQPRIGDQDTGGSVGRANARDPAMLRSSGENLRAELTELEAQAKANLECGSTKIPEQIIFHLW